MEDQKLWFQKGHKNNSLDVIMALLRDEHNNYEYYYDMLDQLEKMGRNGRAITVTFTDTQLCTYKETFLFTQVENQLRRIKGLQYHYLIPEYSDVGRFHLHGVVVCDTLKTYGRVKINLQRKNGITKMKTIDDTQGWSKYCLKSYHPTQ